MATKKIKSSSEVDVETASVVSQILSDILDASSLEYEPSTSTSYPNTDETPEKPNPSGYSLQHSHSACPYIQQEGDNPNINPTSSNKSDKEASEGAEAVVPPNVPYQTCTVKEIISEILDCTVIRIPPRLPPSTSERSERGLPGQMSPPPMYTFDPRFVLPRQFNEIRSDSTDSATSRMQYTFKEVLSEIMDYTVFKKTSREANFYDYSSSRPGTSRSRSEEFELLENVRGLEGYRGFGPGIVNSRNGVHEEAYVKILEPMLPSYSTVLKMGPFRPRLLSFSSCSFVPRKPPPSYAEVEGIWEDSPSRISSESVVFGPDPTYMICPRCRTAVVTEVQMHRSTMTHLLALFLCLCMCWPCCLMPYCLRSCNYTYHSCPHCSHYFGMYRPF